VLGAVVVLLLVVLASPLSRWFASRSALSDAAAQLQRDQQQLHAVQKQLASWGDPGYIQRQARIRLQYAMPGDRTYIVVRPGSKNGIETTARHRPASRAPQSWNVRLWRSVTQADARK
jgi:cell division protein FtsB